MQHLKNGSSLQGGKYKIEKVLGQGGFGITYLATQELLDRKVCIKEFFFKEYCERDEATSHVTLGTQSSREMVERFIAKFLKEARTISKLEHPNIIRIHDIFMENNTAYYVMDYIDGESLSEMVKRRGALSESEAVEYIKQVASALDFIHQHSINHLDVKPANIMVSNSNGKAILIDFGLSKQYDAQGGQTSTTPVGISHGYAPMEQYKQGGVNTFSPQTDIYSLGATLYKLVTGNTPPQAMDLIDEGLPPLPSSLSTSVVEAIKKAMQFRKVDRPENITEFLNILRITIDKSLSVLQSTNTQESKAQSALEETKILDAKQSSSFSTNEAIQPPPQQTDTYKTATAEPSLSSKNLGKDVKNENDNDNGNIAYGCIRGIGWITTILFVLGILISIIAECGTNRETESDLSLSATIEDYIKSSKPIIVESPNYNGNTNKASVPAPNIKKIAQKYIEPTFDDQLWINSKEIDSKETILDAAPSFYNYDTTIKNLTPLPVPLQLGNRYLHIWKKDSDYNYFAYGPYSLLEDLPMRLILTSADNSVIVRDIQFDNYVYAPKFLETDKSYVNQEVRQFKVHNKILYFAHYHSTYAASSCGQNGYISALNLETGKIIWTSSPLTCNSEFVLWGDYIITGYGFTDELDYLYVIDKSNGAFIKRVPLKNGPDIIRMKDNHIYVRTYSYEYEFIIEN